MSIGSISFLARNAVSLLSQIGGAPPAGQAAAGASTPSAAAPAASPTGGLTGTNKASLSDEILALLTQLQQITGDPSGSAAAGASSCTGAGSSSTAIGASSTQVSPLDKLMSALDSNGDGTVSQSEMETYVQNLGGTAAQGDALFSGLNQGNAGNLTQTQLASDLKGAPQAGHHHHHHHAASSANAIANGIVGVADANGDGSLSQSEFGSLVTGLGGTSSEADSDFAALDPGGTGSVNPAQISTAIKAFEAAGSAANIATNGASPILTLLDSLKSASPATASASSITA